MHCEKLIYRIVNERCYEIDIISQVPRHFSRHPVIYSMHLVNESCAAVTRIICHVWS